MISKLFFRPLGAAAVAAALLAPALWAPAHAQFETRAEQAILVDFATGSVLFEKNADDLVPPASMAKIMTLAVAYRALREGRLNLTDEFECSENAWRTGGAPSGTSAMFVPINETVTVEELIQGIAVQSGNDASIILAEGLSGSEGAFASEMNRYAREIGLETANFTNSTGLHHDDQLTTARELAELSGYLIREYPEYYHYLSQREFRYRRHLFHNRNPLVYLNIGADGLKTGYVKESGFGIAASAEQDGRRLVAVLNGMESNDERRNESRRLLEYGFRNFQQVTLFEGKEPVGDALVYGGTQRYVNLVGRDDGVQVLLPRTADPRDIQASIVYRGPLMPPIRQGDQIAYLQIAAGESAVSQVPLYAAEDVEAGNLWVRGLDSLLHLAFGWIL